MTLDDGWRTNSDFFKKATQSWMNSSKELIEAANDWKNNKGLLNNNSFSTLTVGSGDREWSLTPYPDRLAINKTTNSTVNKTKLPDDEKVIFPKRRPEDQMRVIPAPDAQVRQQEDRANEEARKKKAEVDAYWEAIRARDKAQEDEIRARDQAAAQVRQRAEDQAKAEEDAQARAPLRHEANLAFKTFEKSIKPKDDAKAFMDNQRRNTPEYTKAQAAYNIVLKAWDRAKYDWEKKDGIAKAARQ
jgi:hypothetical protein